MYNYYREQFGFIVTRDRVLTLIQEGFITYVNENDFALNFSNLDVTSKGNTIFNTTTDLPAKTKVNDWMTEWYELFPKGLKSGGYLIRSGQASCRAKMIKFMRKHPNFNNTIIINATKLYISEMEKVNYSFMQLAKYFIEKDNSSTLESYCEKIMDKVNNGEEINIELNKGYHDSFSSSLN